MARDRAKKAKEEAVQRNHFNVGDWEVARSTELSNGTVFFDLVINGIKFYGLSIQNGKNGDFISEPSRKGKDGKYYKYYYLNLDEDTADAIMDVAMDMAEDAKN